MNPVVHFYFPIKYWGKYLYSLVPNCRGVEIHQGENYQDFLNLPPSLPLPPLQLCTKEYERDINREKAEFGYAGLVLKFVR